jgi:ethanolamine utilization protein EutQ (cupin superfamily)
MDTTKIPDSFGECVDMLEVVKEQKKVLKTQTDELDKYGSMIKESLRKDMDEQGLSECAGTNMRIKFVTKTKYSLANKEIFCNYIREKEAFELMTAAVNQSAVQERLDGGEEIPGITKYDLVTASLTKRS